MTVYVGIDVAKRAHTGVGLDEHGQVIRPPFTITNDHAGIQVLLDWLASSGSDVAIGLESTGHYWLALYDQLTRAGYEVRVLNPLQVHAFQRSGVRRRKTDSIDAVWIADFIRVSNTFMAPPSPDVILQLRQIARFRFSLTDQIGDAKRKVLAVLDRVFPEYETLFSNIFLASSRQLLAEAVTAQDFAEFDLQEMTQLLHAASRGRFGQAKAEAISQAARQSIGVAFLADAARVEVGCLLAQIEFLNNQVAEIDQVLDQLVAQLPEQYLTSIPGISSITAAAILSEIGDIQRFPTLTKLVAYAGIDPATYESGQFKGTQIHMSKRGSPYLRHALWMAASVARRHDPELKAYYDKRRAEGKAYGTVMGAVCHKLLARIYVVLREQRPYVIRH